jgi:putative ABC transport system permease protein
VLQAAEFQMLVLASILVAGALSVACLTWIFGAPRVIPDDGRLVAL